MKLGGDERLDLCQQSVYAPFFLRADENFVEIQHLFAGEDRAFPGAFLKGVILRVFRIDAVGLAGLAIGVHLRI